MAKINPIELQKYLKGVDYPAKKDDLLKAAGKNGADQNVKGVLAGLPEKDYDTPAAVNKEIGKED